MFSLSAYLKVYLHREPIDFRAGINSLAVLVQEVMELDPFVPAVFGMGKRGTKNDQIRAVRTSSQMSFNEPAKSGLGAALLAIFDHLDREAAGKPEGSPSTPVRKPGEALAAADDDEAHFDARL